MGDAIDGQTIHFGKCGYVVRVVIRNINAAGILFAEFGTEIIFAWEDILFVEDFLCLNPTWFKVTCSTVACYL